MSTLSERILQAITDAGISYGELSKVTQIPKSALQRYATGETEKIPIPRVEAIAAATKVSANYLLGWEEPNVPNKEKPADQYDELDNIVADLLEKIPTKLSEAILKLSPQGIDRLLDYAEFLLERESSGSSAK